MSLSTGSVFSFGNWSHLLGVYGLIVARKRSCLLALSKGSTDIVLSAVSPSGEQRGEAMAVVQACQ